MFKLILTKSVKINLGMVSLTKVNLTIISLAKISLSLVSFNFIISLSIVSLVKMELRSNFD
jgi:hypothetical protein